MGNITAAAAARGNRVLILAHRQELIHQISRTLRAGNVEHGKIAPWALWTDHAVQVGSAQTVVRRLARLPAFDFVLLDECHHAVSPTFRKIVERFPAAKLLGVSATPTRLDGVGLGVNQGGIFDEMVHTVTVADLVERGFLARPRVFAPAEQFDARALRTTAGDFNRADLENTMDKPAIIGDAVNHYRQFAAGKSALAFGVSIQHAANLAASFTAAGFRAENIDGSMTNDERARIVNAFASGAIKVLCSADLLFEGFDCPGAEVAIMCRPTASMVVYRQTVGRVMRAKPGENTCTIIDMVGNVKRHGMPDETPDYSLDSERARRRRETEDEAPAVKQCPRCFAMNRSHVHACGECGHVFEVRSREIAQREGDLVELTPEMIAAERARRESRREVQQARSREALEAIAARRGYSAGWVRHILRARGQHA
jgi:superfamily II DNA or RNA helicase